MPSKRRQKCFRRSHKALICIRIRCHIGCELKCQLQVSLSIQEEVAGTAPGSARSRHARARSLPALIHHVSRTPYLLHSGHQEF